MRYFVIQMLCGLMILATSSLTLAEKAVDPWDLFEPPEDQKFDWIQLTSGEWLRV